MTQSAKMHRGSFVSVLRKIALKGFCKKNSMKTIFLNLSLTLDQCNKNDFKERLQAATLRNFIGELLSGNAI